MDRCAVCKVRAPSLTPIGISIVSYVNIVSGVERTRVLLNRRLTAMKNIFDNIL